MSFFTVLLIGLGLSMDAVAVSISSGMAPIQHRHRAALKMALWFGVFQGLMPALGFMLGVAMKDWVAAVDHWIAFGLLSLIGGKMIYESFTKSHAEEEERADRFSSRQLALLAFATSIDALAVGVSFSLLQISLLQAVAVIGITTFVLCYPAVLLGRSLGELFSKRAELIGGLVLVGIGVKILVEHTILA